MAAEPVKRFGAEPRCSTQLADVAQQQGAHLEGEPAAEELLAMEAQANVMETLSITQDGTDLGQGGTGATTAWEEPHLAFHGQAGLVATTPSSGTYSRHRQPQPYRW